MILHPTYSHRRHNRVRIVPTALYNEMEASPKNTTRFIIGQGLTRDNSFKLKYLTFHDNYVVRCIDDKEWVRITNENTTSV